MTSLVVHAHYAWLVLLGDNGMISHWLQAIGIIGAPLPLSGNMFSVNIIGLVHIALPLMALSLVGVLAERIDAFIACGLPWTASAPRAAGSCARSCCRYPYPASARGHCWCSASPSAPSLTPALLGGNRVSDHQHADLPTNLFPSANWPVGATLVVDCWC